MGSPAVPWPTLTGPVLAPQPQPQPQPQFQCCSLVLFAQVATLLRSEDVALRTRDGCEPESFGRLRLLDGPALDAVKPTLYGRIAEVLLTDPPYDLRVLRAFGQHDLARQFVTDPSVSLQDLPDPWKQVPCERPNVFLFVPLRSPCPPTQSSASARAPRASKCV